MKARTSPLVFEVGGFCRVLRNTPEPMGRCFSLGLPASLLFVGISDSLRPKGSELSPPMTEQPYRRRGSKV
jgi:hypothetical protein